MSLAAQPSQPLQGTWGRWYELARLALGYAHHEAVEYANHRYVEDENRPSLRRANAARPVH